MTEIIKDLFIWIGVVFYGLLLFGGPLFIICYVVAHVVNIFKHKPCTYISSEDETLYGGGGGGGC